MTKIMLTIHIIAVIVAIGPVAVAASMFPPYARRAAAENATDSDKAVLRVLNRICKVYAVVALAVPVFGFATAGMMHVTGNLWIIISIVLTLVAALVLALLVLPYQARILDGKPSPTAQLAAYTGVFNLLWAAVTVIMIFRPGSTLNS